MHCVHRAVLTAFLLGTASIAAAAKDKPPTVDQIIAHNVEARGGAAALEAVKNIRREGVLRVPGMAIELGVVELRERPGKVRQNVTLQGLTAVSAWDGKDGWQIQPFSGRKDPEKLSADEAKALAIAADIDTPLVDYRAKGVTVEYLGQEDVDGAPAHKLRARLASGDEITYFIDPDTWMIIRDVQKQLVRGAEREIETDYGEYEKVGGVFVPMAEASGPKDSDAAQKQQASYTRAEANVPMDAAEFAFPATK